MRKLFAISCLIAFSVLAVIVAGEKRIVGVRANNQLMLLRIDLANYSMDCSVDGSVWSAISGTSGIADNALSLAKLAQVSTGSILGNVSGSTGNVTTLSVSDIKTLIGNATTSVSGLMSGTDKTTLGSRASSGANSDITSLSALTTALSIAQGGTGLNSLGTAGQILTVNSGATGTEWKTISTTSAWGDITGKPVVLAQYNGTIADNGTITLENSVAVSDIAIGSVVKFTSANTSQGIAVGDLYQKKLQNADGGYDDTTLTVSGITYAIYTAANGTYILSSGTGTSRIFYKNGDSLSYKIRWADSHWYVQAYNDQACAWEATATTGDPWENTWSDAFTSASVTVARDTITITDNISLFTPVGKEATTSSAGLMSSSDKSKLDSLFTSVAINAQTDSYTLVLSDKSKLITMSNGSANTLTIPLNSSVAYATGTWIDVINIGAGTCTVTAASGVTLNGTDGGTKELVQWAGARLYKINTDTWIVR